MLPDGKAVAKTTESLINYGSKSIMVDMSSSHPDDTLVLAKKLKENGIIVCPIKKKNKQVITKYTKINNKLISKEFDDVLFVPNLEGKN